MDTKATTKKLQYEIDVDNRIKDKHIGIYTNFVHKHHSLPSQQVSGKKTLPEGYFYIHL
jgi:hypothetical protein